MIVLSNDFINGTYRLSKMQFMIIFRLAERIRQEDTDFRTESFTLSEFVGLKKGQAIGNLYEDCREACKFMKGLRLRIGKRTYQVLEFVECPKYKGYIRLRFAKALQPFFLGLKQNFTPVDFEDVQKMGSGVRIRIYLFLRQHLTLKNRHFDFKKIKAMLGYLPKAYPRFKDFDRRVLQPAYSDIKKFGLLDVEQEIRFLGRQIDKLVVKIKGAVKKVKKAVVPPTSAKPPMPACNTIPGLPPWMNARTLEKLRQEYPEDYLMYAVQVVEQKDNVENPMGYFRSLLPREDFQKEFKAHVSELAKKQHAIDLQKAAAKEAEWESHVYQLFSERNNACRQQFFEQHHNRQTVEVYLRHLQKGRNLPHNRRYYQEWMKCQLMFDALPEQSKIAYKGWLVKTYGERGDYDQKFFATEMKNSAYYQLFMER
ncbi:replication initiation protein [Persicobacter diffluens]|uniref:Initiator Rep protein WH1 domain-containing protein n=1 Tax=Persicobacter diffluens TaxID=981 RepID=A0AAN4W3D5_9BACT|nr:hypothetical protein PEDI_55310 [Persicobacter diffluens]